MRKVILLLFTIICTTASAQNILWFRTTDFAYNYNSTWSDWEKSNLKIKIDTNKDLVVIYSKSIQVYKILYEIDPPYDATGVQVGFKIVDQDGDYGKLRLRIENTGTSQIYIDFNNIHWVYNVVRIQ